MTFRACSRSFDEASKVWRHDCGVFDQVTELAAPAPCCPTCSRTLPALSPPRNRMVRGANDDDDVSVIRDFLTTVVAPSVVLACIALVAAGLLSCASIDPKCIVAPQACRAPSDAGP